MGIKNYGLITSIDELHTFTDRLLAADAIGFDIETGYHGEDREKFSLHPETAIIVGVSFTCSTDWARYIPLAHDRGDNLDPYAVAEWLWTVLCSGLGVAHNAGFELRHLAKFFRDHLWEREEVRKTAGYFPIKSCTQVEAYLAAEQERFGLKYLTERLFGHKQTELIDLFPGLAQNRKKMLRFNTLDITPEVVEYACEDSVWCLGIHERHFPDVSTMPLYEVEMAVVREVLPDMEDYGVRYDWAYMRRGSEALLAFRDKYNAEIMTDLSAMVGETVAINLASSPQLSTILYDKLGYRTNVYTDKTRDLPMAERKMSTGKIALERLAKEYPVVDKVRQWRQMTRLNGTYLEKYEAKYQYADDGHTHPNHLGAFVVTGRFAVSDPPYQQSPRIYHFDLAEAAAVHGAHRDAHGKDCPCKEYEPPPGTCFRFNFRDSIIAPPDHYILGFDLSQAELRAIAGEAQETALLDAFATGQDVHSLTAALMLKVPVDEITKDQRSIGKTMNFALLYGMGVKSLADRLALDIDEAQSLYDKYFQVYANIKAWSDKQVHLGRTTGYVHSRFGRRLPIWEFASDKRYIREKGERACVNYPIQGSATGDYMKIAMVKAVRAIRAAGLQDKIHLVMNVHDALEFYVHRSVSPPDAVAILQDAVIFEVPGWPAMQADWHLGAKLGSPVEVTVKDDGTLIVHGEKEYELKPSVEIDEETGDTIEALPEVDRAAIEPFITREPHEHDVSRETDTRAVVLDLPEMPEQLAWQGFLNYVEQLPGTNRLTVATPAGDIEYPGTTALSPQDTATLSLILGMPVHVHYPADDVDHAALVQGIRF